VFPCSRPAAQHRVVLEYNKDPVTDDWQPVDAGCGGSVDNVDPDAGPRPRIQCARDPHRQGTVYTSDDVGFWTRITLRLSPTVFSRSLCMSFKK